MSKEATDNDLVAKLIGKTGIIRKIPMRFGQVGAAGEAPGKGVRVWGCLPFPYARLLGKTLTLTQTRNTYAHTSLRS